MSLENAILRLKQEWISEAGFFWKLRAGIFDNQSFGEVARLLEVMRLEPGPIDRNLVTLLWDLPLFMEWQTGRVKERGTITEFDYARAKSRVYEAIKRLLNDPSVWDGP